MWFQRTDRAQVRSTNWRSWQRRRCHWPRTNRRPPRRRRCHLPSRPNTKSEMSLEMVRKTFWTTLMFCFCTIFWHLLNCVCVKICRHYGTTCLGEQTPHPPKNGKRLLYCILKIARLLYWVLKKACQKAGPKRLHKRRQERWEKSLFLNLSCCCLETSLKPILL